MYRKGFLFILLIFFIGCKAYQVAFDSDKMRYYDKNNYDVYVNEIPCKVYDLSFLDKSIIKKVKVNKSNKTLQIETYNNVVLIQGKEISDKLSFKFDMVFINGMPFSNNKFNNSFYLKNSIRIIKKVNKDTIQPTIHRYLENDVLWFEYDY